MSLSRRKFMKAGIFATACAALPLKSALGQNGTQSRGQSSGAVPLSSSSKIKLDQLNYYAQSSFAPYLNTQFRVYLDGSNTRGLKLTEVNDCLAMLPPSVIKGDNSAKSECFSLLLTIPSGKPFEQDTYLIEHEALGNFYLFVVPVGQQGKRGLDYYEAIVYRRQDSSGGASSTFFDDTNPAGRIAAGQVIRNSTDGRKTNQEVYYFRRQADPSYVVAPPAVAPGAEGRRAAAMLSMAQAPDIGGLRLGLTVEQALALFPGARDDAEVRSGLSRQPSQFGELRLIIKPWKYSPNRKFDGVRQIDLSFLDGRVSSFYIAYDNATWSHVDNFVAKFSGQTRLPGADSWDAYAGLDTQLKTLRCKDFEINLFAAGNNLKANYVQMTDLTAKKTLSERKARKANAARP